MHLDPRQLVRDSHLYLRKWHTKTFFKYVLCPLRGLQRHQAALLLKSSYVKLLNCPFVELLPLTYKTTPANTAVKQIRLSIIRHGACPWSTTYWECSLSPRKSPPVYLRTVMRDARPRSSIPPEHGSRQLPVMLRSSKHLHCLSS